MALSILIPVLGLGILGLFFGLFLAYASRKFAVETDPKIEQLTEALPGANCGGCGFPGCAAYAEYLVTSGADINKCAPGGSEVAAQIADILGVENVGDTVPVIAAVQCRGGNAEAKRKFQYQGIQDCVAAQMVSGGDKACSYGCLGMGTCVKACPFDAIHMGDNGLPVVDEEKCTGCGNCVTACPRDIITLIPINQRVYLGCVSHDKGKAVKQVCTVGCFGCTLCAMPKVTPSGAIKMDNNLPVINDIYAEDLMQAVEKCPAKCYVVRDIKSQG